MKRCLAAMVILAVASSTAISEPGVPSPSLRRTLDVDWLDPEERSALHLQHGIWDEDGLVSADDRIKAALIIGDYRNEDLLRDDVSPLLAARWLAARGEHLQAIDRLESSEDPGAGLLLGDLLMDLGRRDEAVIAYQTVTPGRSSSSRTDAVTAMRRLAEIDGARDDAYRNLMDAYGAIRESDPLDWTSRIQEAELLLEKNNPASADEAIREVLELNPRLGEAWLTFGRLNLLRFDFNGTDAVIQSLRDIVPDHPMADLLEAESLLKQNDPDAALRIARRLRADAPFWPEAMMLELSIMAVIEDPELDAAMERYEKRFPGSAAAAHRLGSVLSFHRQYPESDRWLRRAIELRPVWPAPWIELGLMQWQDARMEDAIVSLRRAVALDSFNRRSKNSLSLLEEVTSYETIETPHFLVRYAPGIDEILVREMIPRLESVYEDTVEVFGWKPERRTVIELYPDHERFAIRIIGMPDIHTMAACTGPCIAMESPRTGVPSKHMGNYDWERVLRHEFTHTVNLDQTDYRVPLWFTEAAAVLMEPGPRKWRTSRMLATELQAGTLLELDELSWAFVRPRRPQDRSLAYAQSNWMLEFLMERWGAESLQELMRQFRAGVSWRPALKSVTGLDEPAFFELFLEWARQQVLEWGVISEPSLQEILLEDSLDALNRRTLAAERTHHLRLMRDSLGKPRQPDSMSSMPILNEPAASIEDDDVLISLLATHPDHPDVLEAAVRRLMEGGVLADQDPLALAEAYVAIRPGDPLGHEFLARWWEDRGDDERAAEAMKVLVSQEEYDPLVARRLSRSMRRAGRFNAGADAMEQSVGISPYDPAIREEAAAASIEAGRLDAARRHLEALILIEPTEPVHTRRLKALEQMQRN